MPRVKKPEPLSLTLSPLNKSEKKKEEKGKIGIIQKNRTRKMVAIRLRPEIIDLMDSVIKKLRKKTKNKYSQSALIETGILVLSEATVEEILQAYGKTFSL